MSCVWAASSAFIMGCSVQLTLSQLSGQQAPPWARDEESLQKPMNRRIAAPALAALTIALSAATLPAANAQVAVGGGKVNAAEKIAERAVTNYCDANPIRCTYGQIKLANIIEWLLFGF